MIGKHRSALAAFGLGVVALTALTNSSHACGARGARCEGLVVGTQAPRPLTVQENLQANEMAQVAKERIASFLNDLTISLRDGVPTRDVGTLTGGDAFRAFALKTYLDIAQQHELDDLANRAHRVQQALVENRQMEILGRLASDFHVWQQEQDGLRPRQKPVNFANSAAVSVRAADLNEGFEARRPMDGDARALMAERHVGSSYRLNDIAHSLQLADVAEQLGMGGKFDEAHRTLSGGLGR